MRRLLFPLTMTALTALSLAPAHAGTIKMPQCLVYPSANGQVPCTGVVPVDSVTGDAMSWQALFQSLGTQTGNPGQTSGGSVTNPSIGALGQTAPTSATVAGYVGSDGFTHALIGDTAGHPAVSIYGTPTVNLGTLNGVATDATLQSIKTTLGTPFQAGGSIGNTSFGAKLLDSTGAAFGTSANPIYVTGISGGSSGGSSGPNAAATLGMAPGAYAELAGYVGSDGSVYSATGDTSGHIGVSIYGALPTGNNVIGSIANTAFAATQLGSWTVGISSLPSLAPGTNTIGNVNVNGTVAVSGAFYQATQPVSATSLPLPTGAATAANQTTGNTSLASVVTNTTGLVAAVNSQVTAAQTSASTVAANGGTAPTNAVQVGTFAAISTPLTWSSVTSAATLGPWTPQLGRDIWAVFNVTGGSYTAQVSITMTGSCAAATPLTSANGLYALGSFTSAANEDIGAETRASAKWCVTITPGTGASVSGGLYQ